MEVRRVITDWTNTKLSPAREETDPTSPSSSDTACRLKQSLMAGWRERSSEPGTVPLLHFSVSMVVTSLVLTWSEGHNRI